MSAPSQVYSYEAHFKWKWHKQNDAWDIPDEPTVRSQLGYDFKNVFLQAFAEKLAETGHWFKLNDVLTNITKYSGSWGLGIPIPVFNIDVEGETVIYFNSDVKDMKAQNSPGLEEVARQLIQHILDWLNAHPAVPTLLLVAGVLTIFYIVIVKTTSSGAQEVAKALTDVGSNIGAAAIVLGGLAVAGLTIYALFFTKTGRKGTAKAYETGRRAYHGVRRRLQ
jgi:hypothetical protein